MLRTICIITVAVISSAHAACDLQGLRACITDSNQFDNLVREWSPILTSGSLISITHDLLERSCGIFQAFVNCAKTKSTDSCSSTTEGAVFAEIIRNTPIYCNQEWRCKGYVNTCSLTETALVQAYYNKDFPALYSGSLCPAIVRYSNCLTSSLPPTCSGFDSLTADVVYLMDYALRLCKENECSALNTCKRNFNNSNPSLDPFNSPTCTLWKNFVNCAGGALSSCTGISLAAGTPTAATIASLGEETCALISTSGLYSSQSFLNCITASLNDVLSPYSFCSTIQATISCAASSVQDCATKELFNNLAQKAARLGCAGPKPSISCCSDLTRCGSPLNAVMSTFSQKCSAIQTYLSCADSASRSCSSTIVADAVNATPKLNTLSGIASRICTAMTGQTLSTCPQYLTCVEGYLTQYGVKIIPSTDSERVFGRNWCPIMTRSLDCALFYEDQCSMAAPLKATLQIIYRDLLASGCPDQYSYLTRGSGAVSRSVAAVSTWTLIALSLLPVLRLQ